MLPVAASGTMARMEASEGVLMTMPGNVTTSKISRIRAVSTCPIIPALRGDNRQTLARLMQPATLRAPSGPYPSPDPRALSLVHQWPQQKMVK